MNTAKKLERQLGETETSYFLPSREDGANDMYIVFSFTAPPSAVTRRRVSLAWAILQLQHPLWAASIEMHGYQDIRFVYSLSDSAEAALHNAGSCLYFRPQSAEELSDHYINGPRSLSPIQLAYLVVSSPSITPRHPTQNPNEHIFMLSASHVISDGYTFHRLVNDLACLLDTGNSDTRLHGMLKETWAKAARHTSLPPSMEDLLPPQTPGAFLDAARLVNLNTSIRKYLGGHSFPRSKQTKSHNVVQNLKLSRQGTTAILKACRRHGVSFSAAMFAVLNLAWARTNRKGLELPLMMYSALNLRPYLLQDQQASYGFVSIGFFNIVLPAFLPTDTSLLQKTFWHRVRSTHKHIRQYVSSPMLLSKARIVASDRAKTARTWAKIDDERMNGVPVTSSSLPPPLPTPTHPSLALMGVSMIGNLDSVYTPAAYPSISIAHILLGGRQRPGTVNLVGWTFMSQLQLWLRYDEEAFESGSMDRFWGHAKDVLKDMTLNERSASTPTEARL